MSRVEIDEGYSFLFDVWVTFNASRALLDRALRPSGLSAEEFALYSAVGRSPKTPTELGQLMGLPPTTMSSILNRLDTRGHINRVPNVLDARSYTVELTPAGRQALAGADKLFRPVLAQVQAALDRPVSDVREALAAITAAARKTDTTEPLKHPDTHQETA